MYTNSTAKFKLLNKLSDKIYIICGTGQGHPMSPELFKCFLHQLSLDLNALVNIYVPLLNTNRITHLLRADDLVLLALDGGQELEALSIALQAMLNVLPSYCLDWGLNVNVNKTAVPVFNPGGRLLNESHTFTLGENLIPSAREYCYLGVNFTLSGATKNAQSKLRQKGLRGYFSLKQMIDLRSEAHQKINLAQAFWRTLTTNSCICLSSLASKHCRAIQLFTEAIENRGKAKILALDPLENFHLSIAKCVRR
jgi:hypothetical protein